MQSSFAGTYGDSFSGFARCLGVSYGRAQTWREGKRWPGTEDVAAMHDKLGLSYAWLITGEGEPFEQESAAAERESALEAQVAALEREVLDLHRKLEKAQSRLLEVMDPAVSPGGVPDKIVAPMAAREAAPGVPPRGADGSRSSRRMRGEA